jgi:uncharacterized membrane protein YcaP (DUF421 family)
LDTAVVPFDLQRLVFGDQSLLFGLEIVFRTIVVYIYALVLLRWLGSRTIGQLSTVELMLVIALGSAVGDAMFYPNVPLLHSLIVVTVVVLANKVLDVLIARSRLAERAIDGRAKELIVDGVFDDKFLTGVTLGVNEVFQQLRHQGIEHLGQVKFAYVEPSGEVTVFRKKGEVPPGLPIVPAGRSNSRRGSMRTRTQMKSERSPACAAVRCTRSQAARRPAIVPIAGQRRLDSGGAASADRGR